MYGCKTDVYTKDRRRKLNKFFIVSCSRLTLRLLFSHVKAQYTSCVLFCEQGYKNLWIKKTKNSKNNASNFSHSHIHSHTLESSFTCVRPILTFYPKVKAIYVTTDENIRFFIQDWNLDVNETPYYSPTVFSSTWLRQVKSRQ